MKNTNYEFTIDNFQGPLDLLLHLIRVSDITIFDINITEITEQYLAYIESMERLNLNVDSEYLVMAAELIEIKSRELLPNEVKEDCDEFEDDPKENLINRLINYQKYKDMVLEFKDMEQERKLMYSKLPSNLEKFKDNSVLIDEEVSLDDLIKAFMDFKKRKLFDEPLNTVITKKEYSVSNRSHEIMNRLKIDRQIKFEDLFDIKSKDYVVVTFLSILNLAKNGKLKIYQDGNLNQITIYAEGEM